MSEILAAQPQPEQFIFSWEHRAHEDAATWAAEALEGSMRTTFRYRFDGKELYAEDGGALRPIFEDAVIDAKRLVAHHPNLAFELRRRKIELAEYADMVAMAKGESPNTMVTVSDFPPELMNYPGDVGGYNTRRKQTMLRVITREPDGSMLMRSQSLDLSDRQSLEALYSYFGAKPEVGELLGQRIKLQLHTIEQDALTDRLTGIYDKNMQDQYGGEWYAGRPGTQLHNTYEFVSRQQDLLRAVVEAQSQGQPIRELYYNLAAALEKRRNPVFVSPVFVEMPVSWLQESAMQEMSSAGGAARAAGKSFNGCGATLRAVAEQQEATSELGDAGFGNKANEETKYSFSLKAYCRVCQKPPKKGESKKMCGPCEICRSCDSKLSKK